MVGNRAIRWGLAVGVCLAAGASSPATASADAVNTKAVLELSYHSAGFRQYEVTVTSKRKKCLANRKAVVFERFAGGDTKVFHDKTDPDGIAYAEFPGFMFDPQEVFFAKVREKSVGDLRCRAAESKSVVFEG